MLCDRITEALLEVSLCSDTDPADACPVAVSAVDIQGWFARRGTRMDLAAANDLGDLTEAVACACLVSSNGTLREPSQGRQRISGNDTVGASLFTPEGVKDLLASRGWGRAPAGLLEEAARACDAILIALVGAIAGQAEGLLTRSGVRARRMVGVDAVGGAISGFGWA